MHLIQEIFVNQIVWVFFQKRTNLGRYFLNVQPEQIFISEKEDNKFFTPSQLLDVEFLLTEK